MPINTSSEAWNIPTVFPTDAEIWEHLFENAQWLPKLIGPAAFLNESTKTQILPGESVFVRAKTAAGLNFAPAALKLRYYHQDHLGSSSVITDESGSLVEEIANYPFGHPRNEHRPMGVAEAYGFTQKERDKESGLHCVGKRFLVSGLSRFNRIDPVFVMGQVEQGSPQGLNPYSYVNNRPIIAHDPTGEVLNFVMQGLAGAAVEFAAQAIEKAIEGKPLGDLRSYQWGSIVAAGAVSAIAPAIALKAAAKLGPVVQRVALAGLINPGTQKIVVNTVRILGNPVVQKTVGGAVQNVAQELTARAINSVAPSLQHNESSLMRAATIGAISGMASEGMQRGVTSLSKDLLSSPFEKMSNKQAARLAAAVESSGIPKALGEFAEKV